MQKKKKKKEFLRIVHYFYFVFFCFKRPFSSYLNVVLLSFPIVLFLTNISASLESLYLYSVVEFEEVSDSSFDIKILATAAPSCYAALIAKDFEFDVCLATDFPENGFSPDFENLREQKKKNLLKYLESKAITSVDVFITDHIDDASITQLATKNIIINPDIKFSNWLKENLVNFEVRKIT